MRKEVFFLAGALWAGLAVSALAEEASQKTASAAGEAAQATGLSYIGTQRFDRSVYLTEESRLAVTPVLETGILGAVKKDFDLDGKDEIFMVSYEPGQLKKDESSALWFSMLEQGEAGWERSASAELSEENELLQEEDLSNLGTIWTAAAEEFVFVRKYQGEYQFFFENTCFPKYLADGEMWILRGYTYEQEEGFSLIPATRELTFAGSLFEEVWGMGDRDPMVQTFHSLGFSALEAGFGNSVCSQDSVVGMVVQIMAQPIQSQEAVLAWMRKREGKLSGFPVTFQDSSSFFPEELADEGAADCGTEENRAEYILPDSDTRIYSMEEIAALSQEDLKYARNEIFARHGRMFQDEKLQAYFDSKSWYVPQYSPEEFDALQESYLNDAEKANIELILQAESGDMQGSEEQVYLAGEEEIFFLLTEHYRREAENGGGSMTVLEGEMTGDGTYSTQVRTGVPGNPAASQRLYDILVNLQDGMVTETNVITNEIKSYSLFS